MLLSVFVVATLTTKQKPKLLPRSFIISEWRQTKQSKTLVTHSKSRWINCTRGGRILWWTVFLNLSFCPPTPPQYIKIWHLWQTQQNCENIISLFLNKKLLQATEYMDQFRAPTLLVLIDSQQIHPTLSWAQVKNSSPLRLLSETP